MSVGSKSYQIYSLEKAAEAYGLDLSSLPVSMKVLLENVLRHADKPGFSGDQIKAFQDWQRNKQSDYAVAYHPARVLMQDFTGVPAIVDLAAMRDALSDLGGDAQKINPSCPVDLVIDHSVQVDKYGNQTALKANVDLEMIRNRERYQFLKWGQGAFDNFRVVPPGIGICHQVNIEYLAKVVWTRDQGGETIAYPDTVVGTDSHTTMVNALGVLGWGVGGIEAEAVMLGQSIGMVVPDVVGFKLTGELAEGVTATDLVLTICEALRRKGVVGKFVEFYGEGVSRLSLAERATIANMAPEFGATCAFFSVDNEVLRYLRLTGRDEDQIALVEQYAKAQHLWHNEKMTAEMFTAHLEMDMKEIEPCLAGPKRPQDRVKITALGLQTEKAILKQDHEADLSLAAKVRGQDYTLTHGDVVIAAITSCTNTSNPSVLIAAGLLAKAAIEKGLAVKPWVKTSFAPGSKVVVEYLQKLGLIEPLEKLGFYVVGYGCTTCIGNSGPLDEAITDAIVQDKIMASAVLSGNRNFEGRVHPYVTLNWLASPPLVVAYALAGTTKINLYRDPLGQGKDGQDILLKDLWPSADSIYALMAEIDQAMFVDQYAKVFQGDRLWEGLPVKEEKTYAWQTGSTYIQKPGFFEGGRQETGNGDIVGARVLALLGDSITTDHISPAGVIKADSPAGRYLQAKQVSPADFNSYGARRGNHEVMVRGTFANIRIQNHMVPNIIGGYTTCIDSDEVLSIYDAAMHYKKTKTPLVVFAGKEYGTGSSRDWAAKGTLLLGVKVVVAESFERIHRANLVGMGVLPCVFENNSWKKLGLTGKESIDFGGIEAIESPQQTVTMAIHYEDGRQTTVPLIARLDTAEELAYFRSGGILQHVVHKLARES